MKVQITIEDATVELISELCKQANKDDSILNLDLPVDLREVMAEVARSYLDRADKACNGHQTKMAEILGLGSQQNIRNWIKKYK